MNYSRRMKRKYNRRLLLFLIGIFMFGFLTGVTIILMCSAVKLEASKNFTETVQETITTYSEPIQPIEPSPVLTEAPEEEPVLPYTPEELHAMALTLAGECYDNQPQDKRNVAWVICNRARDGRFGEGIIGVVSSTEHAIQFAGYWVQSRPISDNDLEIAEEVLTAYYAGEDSIHDYLYFTGGTGYTNNFR